MSLMHGKLGRIEWDASVERQNLQYGQSWSIDVSHDVVPITAMQDTWESYLGGFRDWTATVECLLDTVGTDISLGPGDPNGFADVKAYLELYLVYDTGTYKMLYGEAICNGLSSGINKDGVATVSYSFQGVSQLAWYSGASLKSYT